MRVYYKMLSGIITVLVFVFSIWFFTFGKTCTERTSEQILNELLVEGEQIIKDGSEGVPLEQIMEMRLRKHVLFYENAVKNNFIQEAMVEAGIIAGFYQGMKDENNSAYWRKKADELIGKIWLDYQKKIMESIELKTNQDQQPQAENR